jgi:hypothetical protein
MKIWGIIRSEQSIEKDVVLEFENQNRDEIRDWERIIGETARALDLSRPVILKKHIRELQNFSRTVFKQADFMENIFFDKFEIEIFPEKTNTQKNF